MTNGGTSTTYASIGTCVYEENKIYFIYKEALDYIHSHIHSWCHIIICRCNIPSIDNDTYSLQSEIPDCLVYANIPQEKNDEGDLAFSKCHVYQQPINKSDSIYYTQNVTQFITLTGNQTEDDCSNFQTKVEKGRATEKCASWVYDESMKTAVSQVCE